MSHYSCCSVFQRYHQWAAAKFHGIKSSLISQWWHTDSIHTTGITHVIADIYSTACENQHVVICQKHIQQFTACQTQSDWVSAVTQHLLGQICEVCVSAKTTQQQENIPKHLNVDAQLLYTVSRKKKANFLLDNFKFVYKFP